MSKFEFEIDDDRKRARYKIHFHFHVTEMKLLGMMVKKIVRMSGSTTPLIPDFTEAELIFAEELWKRIHQTL